MSLIPSLLQAVVNLDGEALVMHVGEKPYVVSPTGQVDLSARGLSFDAVWGILTQLLPPQSQAALEEFGAAQFEMEPLPTFEGERFTVVAARGGDDVWVELRRRRASVPEIDAAASLAALEPDLSRPAESAADRLAAPEPAAMPASQSAAARLAAPEPGALGQDVASFDAPAAPVPEPMPVPLAPVAATPASVVAPPMKADAAPQAFTIEHTSYQLEEIEIDLDAAANVEPEPPPIARAEPVAAPATPAIAPARLTVSAPSFHSFTPAAPLPAPAPAPQPVAAAIPVHSSAREESPEAWETIDLAAEAGPAFDSLETIEPTRVISSSDPVAAVAPVASMAPPPSETPPSLGSPVLAPGSPSNASSSQSWEPDSESWDLTSTGLSVAPPPKPAERAPTPAAVHSVERAEPAAPAPAVPVVLMPPPLAATPAPVSAVAETETPQPAIAPQPAVAAATSPIISAPPAAPAPPIAAAPPVAPPPAVAGPPIATAPAIAPAPAVVPAPIVAPTPVAESPLPVLPTFAPSSVIAPFPATRPSAPSYAVASGDEAPLSQLAVVLPLTRNPIRPEVPPALGEEALSTLDRLLRLAAARGAAALYLSSNARPSLRVDGEMQVVDGPILGPNEVESLLMTLMPERNAEALRSGSATEWIIDLPDLGRVRCMSFRDHRGPGGVFRMMPVRAVSADQLALSREIQALAMQPEGLVIVAGPRSGGKRTLIAALIDLVNRGRRDHIITVEREINIVHDRVGSFVSQRESRGGLPAMFEVAQAALREDPDVLVLEEVRSTALMNVALDAAAAGQLVIGGLPAHSASDAIDRIIDLYPPEQRRQVQLALAQNLRGVIGQVLLRKSGGGRIAARELLLNTAAVASVLAEGKTSQLPLAIEGGRKHGMAPLNDSLVGLVQGGIVTAGEAYRHASDRHGFLAFLNRQGIDTSFARLA